MTKPRTWTIELTCVGLQFRWTKDGRAMLARNTPFPVKLEREPDNPHDPNAVKVVLTARRQKFKNLERTHLGYLYRETAELFAPKFDAGTLEQVKVWVTHIDALAGEATLDCRFRDVPKASVGKKPRKRKRPPGAP